MIGAYSVIQAEGGRVRMTAPGSSAGLRPFDPPLRIDPQVRQLWTDLPGRYPADVNLVPDFPTAASLYREMVRRRSGTTVDGVLAVDPVVLSYLLTVTGPVPMPGNAPLAGSTVVRALLSDAYRDLDSQAQDAYFAAAASAVFDTFLNRSVNPRQLLTVFNRSITERRMLFWSAHPEEQRVLGDSRLTGTLPGKDTVPTVGVFLNDGSGAKLGYYLRFSAHLTVGDCQSDGRREAPAPGRRALHRAAFGPVQVGHRSGPLQRSVHRPHPAVGVQPGRWGGARRPPRREDRRDEQRDRPPAAGGGRDGRGTARGHPDPRPRAAHREDRRRHRRVATHPNRHPVDHPSYYRNKL